MIDEEYDNILQEKFANVVELPKIKGLESSSLVDENDNYYLVYEIPYGTRSLSPEKDSSFNDKSLPDNNEIMRHYIQKIKLEDSTNETYIERHIEVKFIRN